MSNHPTGPGLLVLMCGTAYSGKSTYAQALAAKVDAVVVSLDEINERRGLWGGDGIPVDEWIRTHELATAEVRALLAAGRTVIVDDTSSLRSLRDGWRSVAAGAGFVLIYLDVDHAIIRRRQAVNRVSAARGDVADAVLEQHLAEFEPPGPDESPVRITEVRAFCTRIGIGIALSAPTQARPNASPVTPLSLIYRSTPHPEPLEIRDDTPTPPVTELRLHD